MSKRDNPRSLHAEGRAPAAKAVTSTTLYPTLHPTSAFDQRPGASTWDLSAEG
jgi:hypothetical protein